MPANRRKFSPAFKENAIRLSNEKGSNRLCAEELGIEAHFIQRWRREYAEFGGGSFCGKGRLKVHPEEKASYELEKRLKAAELRYEILEKATPHLFKGNEEIYRFIKNNRPKYRLTQMVRALGVEKKGYYR